MPSQPCDALNDRDRHLLVRAGAFHGPTQHESAHEQENQTVSVCVGGRLVIEQTKRGKECQWNQTRRRHGNRLGHPPDSAPKRHARQHRIIEFEAAGAERHAQRATARIGPSGSASRFTLEPLWCLFSMTQREFSVVKGDGESQVAIAQTWSSENWVHCEGSEDGFDSPSNRRSWPSRTLDSPMIRS